ncbi:MAG: sulfite exporter TauE/SafE family protein [Nitrospirae bacterium]|nr:sulfite exporter TauE/SafE family protein [Nitrospirota bacterium]
MTLPDILAASAVLAAGSALQGAAGFGVAIIAAPVLALIDPALVPGPLLLCSTVLTLLVFTREKRPLNLRGRHELRWAVTGRIFGAAAAGVVIGAMTPQAISIGVGAVVLLGVAISLVRVRIEPAPGSLLAAGMLSGFMGTTTSVGGPPMALIYQHESGAKLRGTLSAYFLIGSPISIAALILAGKLGTVDALTALRILPGVILGFAISGRLTGLIDRGAVRPAVLSVSAIAGIAVIFQGLR